MNLLFPNVDDKSKLDIGGLTTARTLHLLSYRTSLPLTLTASDIQIGDILEIGALQSIRSEDVPAFERYWSLLGTYYNDLACVLALLRSSPALPLTDPLSTAPPLPSLPLTLSLPHTTPLNSAYLPRSSNQSALFALSLLRLLSQNRIAEFHTLLETLESEIKESNEVGWVLTVRFSLSIVSP